MQCNALHCTALHYSPLHCIPRVADCDATCTSVSLHYITSHYITLQYVRLRYMTRPARPSNRRRDTHTHTHTHTHTPTCGDPRATVTTSTGSSRFVAERQGLVRRAAPPPATPPYPHRVASCSRVDVWISLSLSKRPKLANNDEAAPYAAAPRHHHRHRLGRVCLRSLSTSCRAVPPPPPPSWSCLFALPLDVLPRRATTTTTAVLCVRAFSLVLSRPPAQVCERRSLRGDAAAARALHARAAAAAAVRGLASTRWPLAVVGGS